MNSMAMLTQEMYAVLAVFIKMEIVTRIIHKLDRSCGTVRMMGRWAIRIAPRAGVVKAVQVRALDWLMLSKLQQSFRDGKPLSLPADGARIFPFRQLLGYPHHPHLRPVLVFYIFEYAEATTQVSQNAGFFPDLSKSRHRRFFLGFYSASRYDPTVGPSAGRNQENLILEVVLDADAGGSAPVSLGVVDANGIRFLLNHD